MGDHDDLQRIDLDVLGTRKVPDEYLWLKTSLPGATIGAQKTVAQFN
jgi:hypothetical protein